jgi:hypothetical protein
VGRSSGPACSIVRISLTKKSQQAENDEISGTGFAVAEGWVLTARHVVRDPKAKDGEPIRVHWVGSATPPADGSPGTIEWECEALDLALLSCDHPKDVGWLKIDFTRVEQGADFCSWGFPAGAKEKGQYKSRFKSGIINSVCENERELVFQIDSDIKDSWQGYSGAPIIINESDAVGVFVDLLPNADDRTLEGVRLSKIRNNNDHCQKLLDLIHPYDNSGLHKKVSSSMESFIQKLDASEHKLADEIRKSIRSLLTPEKINCLLSTIKRTTLEKEDKIFFGGLVVASQMDEAFPSNLHRFLLSQDDDAVKISALNQVGVEFRMAHFDARHPEFASVGDEDYGLYRISDPPEGGTAYVSPEHLPRLLALDLITKDRGARRALPSQASIKGEPDNENIKNLVNHFLEKRKIANMPTYYSSTEIARVQSIIDDVIKNIRIKNSEFPHIPHFVFRGGNQRDSDLIFYYDQFLEEVEKS